MRTLSYQETLTFMQEQAKFVESLIEAKPIKPQAFAEVVANGAAEDVSYLKDEERDPLYIVKAPEKFRLKLTSLLEESEAETNTDVEVTAVFAKRNPRNPLRFFATFNQTLTALPEETEETLTEHNGKLF